MVAQVHLFPSRQLVLEEMKKHAGVRYTRDDKRLYEVLASVHTYALPTLGAALWELEKRGLISKERRGRQKYFYYSQEETANGLAEATSGSLDGGMSRRLRYTVTYTRDEDGYVVASVPALPGCHSQGRSREEARRNIKEAMRGYLASLKHRGEPLPAEETEQVEVAV